MVIHIYGITLNAAKSADQYSYSYSYQSLSWLAIWCIMTCIMIVSHTNRLENFSQSPCTVPSCRYFLTLIVLHPPGWDCVAVCIPWDKWSANERRPYMAAGGGMVYWKNWIRLRDAKKHTIKAFWWFKGDLISQWIPKFYLCDESNPINPQCGKISANFYISPPHPPHPQFYPQKWWKFRYTSWLTRKIASH